jgi:hypothetical protein
MFCDFFTQMECQPFDSIRAMSGLAGRTWNSRTFRICYVTRISGNFDGFEPLCAFKPFYSRVDLFFANEALARIDHFCWAYELP